MFDYLKWFEIIPESVIDNETGLLKVAWNSEKNEELAQRYISRLARLLAHLRGVVPTWNTSGSQGSEYGYTLPTIEEPDRAIQQLTNLARGHALSQGRNYITQDDIPMIINVVLSTASKERVIFLSLIMQTLKEKYPLSNLKYSDFILNEADFMFRQYTKILLL